MFKHILLPIDDSAASRSAARKAIAFAKEIGARLTGYHALRTESGRVYGDGYRFPHSGTLQEAVREARAEFIQDTARAALDAGVRSTRWSTAPSLRKKASSKRRARRTAT